MHNIRTNPDGYTQEGYIAAREGFWDEIAFTFRPATHAERTQYEEAVKQAVGAKKSAVMCEAIARHVKSWNEVDEQGRPIGVTPATVGLVKSSWLIDKLWNIITGWEVPDARVTDSGAAVCDAAALIDSMADGKPPGVSLLERAEKNSSAG